MKNIFREERHYISEVMQVMLPTDSFNIAIDTKQLLLITLWLHTVMILLPAFAITTGRKVAFQDEHELREFKGGGEIDVIGKRGINALAVEASLWGQGGHFWTS